MYRIGCVPYLNAKPLIYKITQNKDIDLILRPPSQLAKLVRNGKLDAVLLPSIEYFRHNDYMIISRSAITSHKKTGSVRLYHKKAIPYIKTVALDINSSTSNALAKILLEKVYKINPKYITHNPTTSKNVNADAMVTIGDISFKYSTMLNIDVRSQWYKFTKLPFVYAMWVVNRKFATDTKKPLYLKHILTTSKKKGVKAINQIARAEAKILDLSPTFCLQYLTDCIRYNLGKKEIGGLVLFHKYASELGLCKEDKTIDFV